MTRTLWLLLALAALGLAGAWAGVILGPADLDTGQAFSAVFGGGDGPTGIIVRDIRMPRIGAALVAGAGLGAAGAMLQSATRNPLGDPQIFGIGGGAAIVQALAVAGVITFGPWGLISLSVAGSLAVAAMITLFATREDMTPARLALVGISIGALSLAIATGILAASRVVSSQALLLVGGSLANRGWSAWLPALPWLAAGLAIAIAVSGRINLLALGDAVAANLGARPKVTRISAMAAAGVLTGAAVGIAGLVGFVGLLAPHMTRWLAGHDTRTLMLVSPPLGAILTLYSDQVARLAAAPSELPVGLVVTVLGAPVMVYVARRVT
jgi:iron complex transport system permease protein